MRPGHWLGLVLCVPFSALALTVGGQEEHLKVKVGFLYSATYTVDHEQRALIISEVAVDWQEPMALQRKCGHPLPTLTDIGPTVAASKHTTAPINHTKPLHRKRSPDVTTSTEIVDTRLLLTTHLSTSKRCKAELA